MAPIGNVDELAGKYPAAAVDLHAIAAAVWDVGSGRPMKMNERRCRQTCCIAGFGLLFHPRRSFAGSRGAVLLPRTTPKKKAGPKPCLKALTTCRSIPIGIFMEWPRFFAPPVFLPQTWTATLERTIIADTRSIQRDKLLIPYSGPICHHGCRALHHNSAEPDGAGWFGDFGRENLLIDCRACISRSDPVSLRWTLVSPNHARSPCDFPVIFCRSCAKPPRTRRSSRTG